jgi:hypothetical protein
MQQQTVGATPEHRAATTVLFAHSPSCRGAAPQGGSALRRGAATGRDRRRARCGQRRWWSGGRPPPSLYPLTSASRGDGVTVGRRWRNEVEGGGDWGEGSRNPNYPYSYLLKTLIWIFVFVFNMDIRWMYSDPIFNIIRIRHYPKYPAKIRHI